MEEEWINRRLQEKKLSRKECCRMNNYAWAYKLEKEIETLRQQLHEIQMKKRAECLTTKKCPCSAVTGQELR